MQDDRHPDGEDAVEHELTQLINNTGKLRMLSHQIVMCALLHTRTPEGAAFTTKQRAACDEFCRIADILKDPSASASLSAHTAARLVDSGAVTPESLELIDTFRGHLATLSQTHEDRHFNELGRFVSNDLLACLNGIIDRISTLLDDVAAEKRETQAPLLRAATHSLQNIDRLSKTLQIVAMNASLEANRAGDHGVAFGIIAREMREIGAQSNDEASRMRDDLTRYRQSQSM